MSARQEILNGKFKDTPTGKAALRAAGGAVATADLFAGFVGYASENWNYSAQSGAQTAPSLLSGDGTKNVACGTLREALKIMMREDLKLAATNADINEYFLTKPGLECFDSNVKGNVGNFGATTFNLACHFSTHYFVESGGKFYDACLTAVYSNKDGPIAHRTRLVMGSSNLRKAGTGRALVILKQMLGRTLPGFGTVWEILTPAECKQPGVLSAQDLKALKNDPDVKASKLF
jgi:hypothetical protein